MTAAINSTQPCARQRRDREHDRWRSKRQVPIAAPMYCVLYLKEGKEQRTAWLSRYDHAHLALQAMRRRYGEKNAIIYAD